MNKKTTPNYYTDSLFDKKERSSQSYANYQHNSYDFYNDSNKDEFVAVRQTLEAWFSRYPETGKKQLKRDFEDRFEPAFFELFIHELFYQQGFNLVIHPKVPNSSKNPDFLAIKGDLKIYLEARVSTDESVEEKDVKSRQNVVYDTINQITTDYYGISVREIEFLSSNTAKMSSIRKYFQREIDENAENLILNKNGFVGSLHEGLITYADPDIRVSITLWKVDFKLDRPIISPLGGGYVGGSEESIKGAIKAKGYKYKKLDKPYIICINSLSVKNVCTEDVYNALFGSSRYLSSNELNLRTQQFKTSSDGIFVKNSKPSYGIVSGVFITRVFPSNLHIADHWLIEHPFTKNELNFDSIYLSHIRVRDEMIEEVHKKSISDIINFSLD